jgi:branched-chain amino acid transport system permease protein
MIVNLLDIVITGLILGGIYALIAVGLSLQYGVGRVLNVSHGEFIMLGALITLTLFLSLNVSPFVSIAIVVPALFFVGYGIHHWLFNYLRKTSANPDHFSGRSLLASFGLLFVAQNLMLLIWGANITGYSYLTTSVSIFGTLYAVNRLVALGVAVGVSVIFFIFITSTRLGKAIRAAAGDPDMAHVIGVNIKQVLSICFALGATLAGLAGVLISLMFELQPSVGIEYTIVAIVVVVFGGLGSITGSLIGGFLLGLVISFVNFIDPSLSLIAFYLIFMLLLVFRPSGILGRQIYAD